MNRSNSLRMHSVALTGLALLCVPALSHAVTRSVPSVYPNIQAAINAAVNGDTVLICPGVYSGPGNVSLDPGGKAITIKSSGGPGSCTIDGGGANQIFLIHSGETSTTVISGFTLEHGFGSNGGAMYISASSPTLSNCVFKANQATNGGGCYAVVNSTDKPKFSNCTFIQNQAGNGQEPVPSGGGLMLVGGAGSISNCVFVSNGAVSPPNDISNGGGLMLQSDKTKVTNCAFNANASWNGGGAQADSNSLATFTNCTFDANNGYGNGGGMDVTNGANPTLTNCTFTDNFGAFAGGLASFNSASGGVKVSGCVFDGNTSNYLGAGLGAWGGTLTVTNSLFSNNTAPDGAGLWTGSLGKNTITDCTFDSNNANGTTNTFFGNGNGGGLWVYSGNATVPATIIGCLFTHNNASYGGGAASNGKATFIDCVFDGNTAGNGAGLLQYTNTLVAVNCLFTFNTASAGGGGILTNGATAVVTECSFFGNLTSGNYGDGIYIEGSSHLTVSDSIVWDSNDPTPGNDLKTDGSPLSVQYTDCYDGIEPGTGNLSANPQFVDPANGDLFLQATSPCLQKGKTTVPNYSKTDIDGTSRSATTPDLGPYEG